VLNTVENFNQFLGRTVESQMEQIHSAKSQTLSQKNFNNFRMDISLSRVPKNWKRYFNTAAPHRRRQWRGLLRRCQLQRYRP